VGRIRLSPSNPFLLTSTLMDPAAFSASPMSDIFQVGGGVFNKSLDANINNLNSYYRICHGPDLCIRSNGLDATLTLVNYTDLIAKTLQSVSSSSSIASLSVWQPFAFQLLPNSLNFTAFGTTFDTLASANAFFQSSEPSYFYLSSRFVMPYTHWSQGGFVQTNLGYQRMRFADQQSSQISFSLVSAVGGASILHYLIVLPNPIALTGFVRCFFIVIVV
jgi:hypothetical protein